MKKYTASEILDDILLKPCFCHVEKENRLVLSGGVRAAGGGEYAGRKEN